jgi:hypothetical protein
LNEKKEIFSLENFEIFSRENEILLGELMSFERKKSIKEKISY